MVYSQNKESINVSTTAYTQYASINLNSSQKITRFGWKVCFLCHIMLIKIKYLIWPELISCRWMTEIFH